jgi:hypothetical protein
LRNNIAANADIVEIAGNQLFCATLPFGEQLPFFQDGISLEDIGPIDVILGADIGYDPSLHEPIANTLRSLVQHSFQSFEPGSDRDLSKAVGGADVANKVVDILLVEEVRWNDIHEWYVGTLEDFLISKTSAGASFIADNSSGSYQNGGQGDDVPPVSGLSAASWSGTIESVVLNDYLPLSTNVSCSEDGLSAPFDSGVTSNSSSKISAACDLQEERTSRSKHPIVLHHIRCTLTERS